MFGICVTQIQIVTGCLAARNDCLEEKVVFLFDEWNQVHIAVMGHDENSRSWVLCLVRVSQDVQQAPGFDRDDDALERNPSVGLAPRYTGQHTSQSDQGVV